MAIKEKVYPNILLTLTHLGPGGVQNLVIPLASELINSGFIVTILCYNPIENEIQQRNYEYLKKSGVKVIVPGKKFSNAIERLFYTFKALIARKIDVVHVHTPIPNMYLGLFCLLFNKRQIVTFHSIVLWTKRKEHLKGNLKLKILSPTIWKYVSISDSVKQSMKNYYQVSEKKIITIYNGISLDVYNSVTNGAMIKDSLRIDKNSFVITQIGTIDFEIKCQNIIVELYERMLSFIPNLIVLFVGEGKDFERLRVLVSDKERIRLLGNRSDIDKILSITDISILPSSKEGLPLTLLESMAAGKTIIASSVGSIPEVITHSFDGLLFNYPDFEEFISNLKRVVNDTKEMERLGKNSKKTVMKYSFDSFVMKHVQLYNSYLKSNQ